MVAHIIVVGTVCSLIIASLLITNQAPMQFFSRLNLGLPATICAALAFIYDSAFRFGSRSSDLARWLVATMFFVYAALFLFFHTATFLPPLEFNIFGFGAVSGLMPDLTRGIAIVLITMGALVLLKHFDVATRQNLEERIADIKGALTNTKASLKRALDFGKLGSWEWNIVTGEVDWSDQTYRIYGLNMRETKATYSSFVESVHPEDRAAVEQEMKRVLKDCIPYKS